VAVRPSPPTPSHTTVRLRDEDGLIALAEPREDGMLKPVVGFRG
jgi:tRNA pseudouridine55 synthase